MFLVLALAICFIISVIITDLMTKKYKKVMNDTSKCFKQLAQGDFTSKIEIDTNTNILSTVVENKGIEFRVTLNNSDINLDLFKNLPLFPPLYVDLVVSFTRE